MSQETIVQQTWIRIWISIRILAPIYYPLNIKYQVEMHCRTPKFSFWVMNNFLNKIIYFLDFLTNFQILLVFNLNFLEKSSFGSFHEPFHVFQVFYLSLLCSTSSPRFFSRMLDAQG